MGWTSTMAPIDPGAVAARVANALRTRHLNGVVVGLEHHDVAPAELPVLMGFVYAAGEGDPRWALRRWIRAVDVWITERMGLEKGARIRPGVNAASKAIPNWLKPHEMEAWTYARNRAGLRIDGIEDAVRAKLRNVMADAIALARPREQTVALITEKMSKAFESVEKDWKRIATTEMAAAFNEGVVTVATATGKRLFSVVTSTGACKVCRDTYDGKTFTHAQLVPVMPPRLHPNCRCVVMPISG